MAFNHNEIEAKWQKKWAEKDIFHVTEWKKFRMPSWGVTKKAMKEMQVLIDGRNVFSASELGGIAYLKIG